MRRIGFEDVRSGRVDFRLLLKERRRYLENMARYYVRRLRMLAVDTRHVDVDDFRQIAIEAMWSSIVRYEWRCQQCARAAANADDLRAHEVARHGQALGPIGTIDRYVHGEVGRALDHEVTRYARRQRFTGPYEEAEELFVPPGQLTWIEFREHARRLAR